MDKLVSRQGSGVLFRGGPTQLVCKSQLVSTRTYSLGSNSSYLYQIGHTVDIDIQLLGRLMKIPHYVDFLRMMMSCGLDEEWPSPHRALHPRSVAPLSDRVVLLRCPTSPPARAGRVGHFGPPWRLALDRPRLLQPMRPLDKETATRWTPDGKSAPPARPSARPSAPPARPSARPSARAPTVAVAAATPPPPPPRPPPHTIRPPPRVMPATAAGGRRRRRDPPRRRP